VKVNRFEDLDCWKEARGLTREIYEATSSAAFKRDYGLVDQARRAAISIMANIAEGFSRQSDKEFTQFLFISKSSASELQSHLYVALDQGYIDESCFHLMYDQSESIHKKTSNLVKYLKSSTAARRSRV
jgi:four helix bundle protein